MSKRKDTEINEKIKEAIIKKRKYSNDFYISPEIKEITIKNIEKKVITDNKEEFLSNYSWRFSQLETSIDKLLRFPILLSSTHSNLEKRGITKADQYIYHIENYLSEVYIFEQRVKKFIGYLEKISKKYKCSEIKINQLTKSGKTLFESIKSLIDIRGSHIHDKSFYTDDLYKIELFEKLSKYSKIESEKNMYKGYAKILLTLSRHEWKEKIRNNNNYCEAMLLPIYKASFDLKKEIYDKIT